MSVAPQNTGSDFHLALQTKWHLKKQIFDQNHEEILAILPVTLRKQDVAMRTKASVGRPALPFLLVLTAQQNKADKSGGDKTQHAWGNPKLHEVKVMAGPGHQHRAGKARPLKVYERFECLLEGGWQGLNLFSSGRRGREWFTSLVDVRLLYEFIWWASEAARQLSENATLSNNLEEGILSRLTLELTGRQLEDISQQELNAAQKHMLLSIKARQQQEERKGLEQSIELPSMTNEEAQAVCQLLEQFGLNAASIHKLEPLLRRELQDLESENIKALFTQRTVSLAEDVRGQMGLAFDNLASMQMWLQHHDAELNRMCAGISCLRYDAELNRMRSGISCIHHDAELNRMRAGIDRIESRNLQLQVQEQNHEALLEELSTLLDDLELEEDVVDCLTNPDFADDLVHVLDAAEQLDEAIHSRQTEGLEDLQAVKDQRKLYENLKVSFVEKAASVLEEEFKKQAMLTMPRRSSVANTTGVLKPCKPHRQAHQALMEKERLAQLLERLQRKAFEGLREPYTELFSKVYAVEFRQYFSTLKKQVLHVPQDGTLKSMPNWVLGTGMPEEKQEKDRGDKVLITEAFSVCIHTVLPVILEEQAFVERFFGINLDMDRKREGGEGLDWNAKEQFLLRQDEERLSAMQRTLMADLQAPLLEMIEWGQQLNPLYSLQMLVDTEKLHKKHEGCSVLIGLLQTVQKGLQTHFNQFIDDQCAAIKSTKVGAKRAGVLSPVAKFPSLVHKLQQIVGGSRSMVLDAAYHKLASTLFNWVGSIAVQEEKYTDKVLFENHHFCWKALSEMQPAVPALQKLLDRSEQTYQDHMRRYLEWSIKYEMKEVSRFWDLLEENLKLTEAPDEIPYTEGLSKAQLRELCQVHLNTKQLNISVIKLAKRVQKHFATNPALKGLVWDRLTQRFLQRYIAFDRLVLKCYQNEQLQMSGDVVLSIFMRVGETELRVLRQAMRFKSLICNKDRGSPPTYRVENTYSTAHHTRPLQLLLCVLLLLVRLLLVKLSPYG
eukprot:g7670.t1